MNPDGDYTYYQKGFMGSASYTHVFSDATFLDVLGSMFVSDYKQYVYANPLDPRYTNPQRMQDVGGPAFYTGGTQNWHFYHKTTSYTGKLDLTSQITPIHQIKAGAEFDYHVLNYTGLSDPCRCDLRVQARTPCSGQLRLQRVQEPPVSARGIRSG